MKSEYEKTLAAIKKWNERRAINEKIAINQFYKNYSSPILHPSKSKPTQS